MKRLVVAVVCLLLAAGVFAAWAVWYARPAQSLDLAYEEVSFAAKFNEMVRNRQPAFELSERDINNLLKKKIAENPVISADARVTGAQFTVQQDLLTADINLLYKDKYPVDVRLHYLLDWHEPDLRATYRDASIKGISLPKNWLHAPDYRINVNGQLPAPISVKEVAFGDKSVKVWLKLQGLPGLSMFPKSAK